MANSGSTSASDIVWNARSHAAYHGYSHLSGIEMMSALFRCFHSWLRPRVRSRWRRRLAGIALQPLRHVVVEELLAPDHPGQRLPLDEPLIVGQACLQAVVEVVGLATAPLDQAVEAGKRLDVRVG